MGKKLKHGESNHKLALFKKTAGEYERIEAEDESNWSYSGVELHEQPILNGSVGVIKSRIDHKENKGLESYIKKHNEFSTWEANRYLKTGNNKEYASLRQRIKYVLLDSWWCGRLYFFYIYVIRLGFLDGQAGYIFAHLKKQYFFTIKAKIEEFRINRK